MILLSYHATHPAAGGQSPTTMFPVWGPLQNIWLLHSLCAMLDVQGSAGDDLQGSAGDGVCADSDLNHSLRMFCMALNVLTSYPLRPFQALAANDTELAVQLLRDAVDVARAGPLPEWRNTKYCCNCRGAADWTGVTPYPSTASFQGVRDFGPGIFAVYHAATQLLPNVLPHAGRGRPQLPLLRLASLPPPPALRATHRRTWIRPPAPLAPLHARTAARTSSIVAPLPCFFKMAQFLDLRCV